MKKVVLGALLIMTALFIVGCVDYKSYDASEDDNELINEELAQLEAELEAQEQTQEDEQAVSEETQEPVEQQAEFDHSIEVDETDLVKLDVELFDPDNDQVTYSVGAPLTPQGEWQTNYGDAGQYIVSISASDGELTTEEKLRLIVNRVNVAPVISAISDITVREGETVEFTPQVTDPNGDDFQITISEPLSEGVFVADHTTSGDYSIRVSATDGELTTEESFILSILDVNQLPQIQGVEDIILVKEGETLRINPQVTDVDGDEIDITISDPVGDDGEWKIDFTDNGEYIVTIRADDGKDVITKTVQIVVEDVNKAPQIVSVTLDRNE